MFCSIISIYMIKTGATAIMHAAACGRFDVVQMLRNAGAELYIKNKVSLSSSFKYRIVPGYSNECLCLSMLHCGSGGNPSICSSYSLLLLRFLHNIRSNASYMLTLFVFFICMACSCSCSCIIHNLCALLSCMCNLLMRVSY